MKKERQRAIRPGTRKQGRIERKLKRRQESKTA